MFNDPQILRWVVAYALLGLFVWVGLGLVFDNLPFKVIDKNRPFKQDLALFVIILLGLASLYFFNEGFVALWKGIKHILLLDIDEMGL